MYIFAAYVVTIISIVLAALYFYCRGTFSYWKKRNVITLKNHNLLFGDFADVFAVKKSVGVLCKELYDSFGDEPYGGVYFFVRPILLLKDEALLKQVLIKDFSNFHSRGMYYDTKKIPISGHLFSLAGTKWRRMRVKLTPTFTTGRIKMMLETLVDCCKQLNAFLEEEIKKDDEIDMKEVLARLGTDVVASVAFGLQCNSINNPDEEFRKIRKKIFHPTLMLLLRNMSYFFLHFVVKCFNISPTDSSVAKFMTDVIYDTVNYREKNGISRPDFLNLLIELKKEKPTEENGKSQQNGTGTGGEKDTEPITMDEIVAQAFIFFAAGYETTATTTGFCLYELAFHPDIQTTVRQEIDEALRQSDKEVTYELLSNSLPYTDKVVNETLRLYPAVPFLTREAADTIKLSTQSGKSVVIDKGQQIAISVMSMHRDPRFFSNPEVFDPERFSPENCKARPQFTYIPFGEGPRICLGMRFALIQVKLSLVTILSRYKIETCSRTPVPIKLDARSVVPFPEGGLYLRLVPRDDRLST